MRYLAFALLLLAAQPILADSSLPPAYWSNRQLPDPKQEAQAQALMQYYWATIENCVAPEVVLQAMRDSGFRDVRCSVGLDLFRCYAGRKR